MKKIKCITFDKEAQDSLPNHIKEKMRVDRKTAQKNFKAKGEQQFKELLKKAFDAGYDTSVMYNCGSCDGAFESFDEWYNNFKK